MIRISSNYDLNSIKGSGKINWSKVFAVASVILSILSTLVS